MGNAHHQALVELKAAIAGLTVGLAKTERELAAERQHQEDATRRGALAAEIGDAETAELGRTWAQRHGERVALLERRLAVQQDELAYAERQLAEWQAAPTGGTPGGQAARAALVQEQLAHLKRKLGRDQ